MATGTAKPFIAQDWREKAYAFDWIIIVYSLVMVTSILIFGRPMNRYWDELTFYVGVTGLAVLIVHFVDESAGFWSRLVRLLYPAVLFGFFYRTTGGLMQLYFDSPFDWQLTTMEKMFLGINPTIYIDQHYLGVFLNELFSFCYFSYYLMLPLFVLSLFFFDHRMILKRFLAASAITFFLSYMLFWLYPVEGPRWFYSNDYVNQIDGPLFRQMSEWVINTAAVRGGAMPSSHTGVALVITMFCWRRFRPWGWIMAPLTIGLAVGTVWGRFHYLSDTIVGAVLGLVATLVVWRYQPDPPREQLSTKEGETISNVA